MWISCVSRHLGRDLVIPRKKTISSAQQGVSSDDTDFPHRRMWTQSLQVAAGVEVGVSEGCVNICSARCSSRFRLVRWQQVCSRRVSRALNCPWKEIVCASCCAHQRTEVISYSEFFFRYEGKTNTLWRSYAHAQMNSPTWCTNHA